MRDGKAEPGGRSLNSAAPCCARHPQWPSQTGVRLVDLWPSFMVCSSHRIYSVNLQWFAKASRRQRKHLLHATHNTLGEFGEFGQSLAASRWQVPRDPQKH